MTGPAPQAPREMVVRTLHGIDRPDAFAYLARRDDPRTVGYLAAESRYYLDSTAHIRPLRDRFAARMRELADVDLVSVGWRAGAHIYCTRLDAGKDYPVFVRRPVVGGPEHVLVDGNVEAAGSDYCNIEDYTLSADHTVLAFSEDRSGDEYSTIRFRSLDDGQDLPDRIEGTFGPGAFVLDDTQFLYVVLDDAFRPYELRCHTLGTPVAADRVIYTESDRHFEVSLRSSRSGAFVVVTAQSRSTSECYLVDVHDPQLRLVLVRSREHGVEYNVEHAPGDVDRLAIVSNLEHGEFALYDAPVTASGVGAWTLAAPARPGERLYGTQAFRGHLIISGRRGYRPFLRIVDGNWSDDGIVIVPQHEAGSLKLGDAHEFDVDEITLAHTSYAEPTAWYSVSLDTGAHAPLYTEPVPGHVSGRYVTELVSLPRRDGADVHVTLTRKADVPLDGSAPCLIYAYGAYESVDEPEFDRALVPLLDAGTIYAHAHIRGGGEYGREGWLDGRLGAKQHTFDDAADAARGLAGLVDAQRIAFRGISAGGLLAGAMYTQSPELFALVIAEVPFVDVVTTMLDDSIPLTVGEWEEWGDPRDQEQFDWLLRYSPYDNLPAPERRTNLLVTAAVHDSRVMYWEPAKWVAALRASGSDDTKLLFRIELGDGAHGGPSGRLGRFHYEADLLAHLAWRGIVDVG